MVTSFWSEREERLSNLNSNRMCESLPYHVSLDVGFAASDAFRLLVTGNHDRDALDGGRRGACDGRWRRRSERDGGRENGRSRDAGRRRKRLVLIIGNRLEKQRNTFNTGHQLAGACHLANRSDANTCFDFDHQSSKHSSAFV